MSIWVWSGKMAVIFGTVAFLAMFVPILSWQFRRYGEWNPRRMIGAAMTSLYLTALITYTWLPLPPRSEQWCSRHGVIGARLEPLAFLHEIPRAVHGLGRAEMLANPVFLQVAFNVLLFVPWGVLMRRYLQHPVWLATLTGLGASLFIEATQYTGLWFIYPCAYRHADIDDILTNTTGALLGALIAPLLLWWMPSERQAAARRLSPRPVTIWRRWTGQFIDIVAAFTLSSALAIAGRIGYLALGGTTGSPTIAWIDLGAAVATYLLIFIFPALDDGGSLGQHIVWLRPKWPVVRGAKVSGSTELGDGPLWKRLLRPSLVSVPVLAAWASGSSVALLAALVLVATAVLSVAFTSGRGVTFLATGAVLVDERDTDPQTP